MKHYKVYLILAHKKPEQLANLISMLTDNASLFFIHVDKKVDLNVFDSLRNTANCQFIAKREKGVWGGFGIVQGTLNGLRTIDEYMNIHHPNQSYHSIILSGEDLPLKNNHQIQQYLTAHKGYSIIPHWKLPYENWWNGGIFRFESCYFFDFQKHKYLNRLTNKIVKKLKLNFLVPYSRLHKHFPDLQLYGSSQWMILSQNMVKKLLTETTDFNKLRNIFKSVLLPDETFIITYIYNFCKDEIPQIENQRTHLVIFNGNNNNPEYLSIDQLNEYSHHDFLFARKFDQFINPESMAYVQNKVRS